MQTSNTPGLLRLVSTLLIRSVLLATAYRVRNPPIFLTMTTNRRLVADKTLEVEAHLSFQLTEKQVRLVDQR
jgi:hypothetical protein